MGTITSIVRRFVRASVRAGRRLTRGAFTVGSLVGVVRGDSEILVVRSRHQDTWTLPGGFKKRRELVERAAARELREETGLEGSADDLTFLGFYMQRQARHFDAVHWVREETVMMRPARRSWEIRECEWVQMSEAEERFNDDGRAVLAMIRGCAAQA